MGARARRRNKKHGGNGVYFVYDTIIVKLLNLCSIALSLS